MKRFWLVLLSLGLVMAFSASAFAVDVKFSGSFEATGMYLDKTSFTKDTGADGPNAALYFQRLRVRTDFVVSPGLSLITRADILERAWGAARSNATAGGDSNSMGTQAENENIAFDWAYVSYASPIGIFTAGYMINGAWATVFGNSENQLPKIGYMLPIGNFTLIAQIAKASESSINGRNPVGTAGFADADYDLYYLMGIYNWKTVNAGLGIFYVNNASTKPTLNLKRQYFMIEPYVKATFGPVYVEAEVDWLTGKWAKTDNGVGDVNINSWNAYVSATATFGPVYFGGTFAYVMGDNTGTTDKEDGFSGGNDFNPCLLMFNYDRSRWAGALNGYAGTSNTTSMTNVYFYQAKVGFKPTAKADIMASIAYANADQKPAAFDGGYGWEVDVTGTYKITDNLSYMLGAGYFAVGDYYKAGVAANQINNNYIVVNKLTLTF